ncbi:MAG: cysteine--tRNA ligase [Candidatus Falkowbacteria bacterium]|nr:MAG: cysteine--tRNA ligase [Candidatus Falkowbacteria bacterium]
MPKIYLYNTLTRQKEIFKPIKKGVVGLYTCGPTVYNFAHIGNLRTYLFEDFLKRTLEYNSYRVKHIMNVTDVGHLTGDMDMGEDKMEAGAKREGKTAWEIADFYETAFKKDLLALNITSPSQYCRVTDNIPEQIALINKLEKGGFTYKTSDGLYFDTAKIKNYNKLSHLPLATLKEGARVEKNPEKKNPTDFALWKFSPVGKNRQMEWQSPWGIGFPGWHIECSAISLKYLSKNLDIHCGGADHINIHHTNEIAQSEAATGKKFFNYWLHGAFLNITGGKKMAKSADNFLTIDNALLKKGLSPLAYRFAACQVHYRKPMEYSEASLKQAQQGLQKLWEQTAALGNKTGKVNSEFKAKFLEAINNDLNLPKALAVLAAVLKAKLKPEDKLATILDFDRVLGFNLHAEARELKAAKSVNTAELFPAAIANKVGLRNEARRRHDWVAADKLRGEIETAGYLVEDTATGSVIKKK